MKSKRAKEDTTMAIILFPCYGGPNDGKFCANNKCPAGYREFEVRGRMVYLWNTIKVERLCFDTLARASKLGKNSSPGDEPE